MHIFHKWMRKVAANFGQTFMGFVGFECAICGKRKVEFGEFGGVNRGIVREANEWLEGEKSDQSN